MTPSEKRPRAKAAAKAAPKPKTAAKAPGAKAKVKNAGPKTNLYGAKQAHWDITGIDDWGASKHELGATIPEGGNSTLNITGGWRTNVPVIDSEKCTGCMLCYFYCPDASIIIENGKAVGVDLDHCKGCGICATECPADAITMKVEEKE